MTKFTFGLIMALCAIAVLIINHKAGRNTDRDFAFWSFFVAAHVWLANAG